MRQNGLQEPTGVEKPISIAFIGQSRVCAIMRI
jgi:hypothetical protein